MEALKNWTTLNKTLMRCGEQKASDLFAAEMKGRRRPSYLRRIHSRLCMLRARRERRNIEKATARNR